MNYKNNIIYIDIQSVLLFAALTNNSLIHEYESCGRSPYAKHVNVKKMKKKTKCRNSQCIIHALHREFLFTSQALKFKILTTFPFVLLSLF